MMSPWQWLLYLFFWSLFVTVIDRHDLATWSHFLAKFLGRIVQNVLTVLPALYLIDYLRPMLKNHNPIKVSMRILLLLVTNAAISVTLVMLVLINMGWLEYEHKAFIINVLLMMVITGGFTLVFLLYFIRRHRELMALKQSFEQKLAAQNDIIKARLAPHFFFNTINSLSSLIESDPQRASELLQHVSMLFRASFSGVHEISFEEEVALCEHYLAIESSRLADKLKVTWQLPDDDMMYDMVITALTLQGVLEKMLLNVVEMTTETVHIDIAAVWRQHRVTIIVTAALPSQTFMVLHDLRQHVEFHVQAERLRIYFGDSADIQSTVTTKQIVTVIEYPLQDVGI